MRVAQIILSGASEYERKSQRIDAALPGVERAEDAGGFDLAHVYGPAPLPRLRIGAPYVANAPMPRRWWQRRLPQPRAVVTPFDLPEAVEEAFFAAPAQPTHASSLMPHATSSGLRTQDSGLSLQHSALGTQHSALATQHPALSTQHSVGVFLRASVRNIIEQTMHRLERTRDDIVWRAFEAPPGPGEMASVAVWVDPAIETDDYDGCTAEALVAGRVVVASRTPVNLLRTEKGRTALLVPPRDSNELTHAILAALFKPESGQQRAAAARQTISKFRPRQRHRALTALYETLLHRPL